AAVIGAEEFLQLGLKHVLLLGKEWVHATAQDSVSGCFIGPDDVDENAFHKCCGYVEDITDVPFRNGLPRRYLFLEELEDKLGVGVSREFLASIGRCQGLQLGSEF